jgi:ubiquinol-cytochrome c reductase cytochrome b subunit
MMVFLHLIFLHETRRTRSLSTRDNFYRISFSPFFTSKDFLNIIFFFIFFIFCLNFPWTLGDPENWVPANALASPVHIQPEWYFLFAYAILRCIPRKLGGVIALVLRVVLLYFLPFFCQKYNVNFIYLFVLSIFFTSFFILTWLGSCPVEEPFIFLRQFFRLLYFRRFFLLIFL